MLIFCFCLSLGNTQNRKIDSLKGRLEQKKSLTSEILLLNKISAYYSEVNIDSSKKYLDDARKKLKKIPDKYLNADYYMAYGIYLWKSGQVNDAIYYLKNSASLYSSIDSITKMQSVYNIIGNCYHELDMYDSAYHYHKMVTEMFDISSSDSEKFLMLGLNYNNLANIHFNKNNNKQALDYYLKALDIFRKLKNYEHIAVILDNIGRVNMEIKDNEKAIKYFKDAIKINEVTGNKNNLCKNYNGIGVAYQNINQYDSSYFYFNKAVKISENSGFNKLLAKSNHNLGTLFIKMKEYDQALKYLEKSLHYYKELKLISGEINNMINIGKVYSKTGDYKLAEKFLKKALAFDHKYLNLTNISDIYKELLNIYEKSGRYKEAVEYFRLYESIKDSIYDIDRLNQVKELETKYETEQKQKENLQLRNQNEINQLVIERQRMMVITASLILFLTVVIIFILVINWSNRKKQLHILRRTNELIEQKSLQLKESNYTKDLLFSIIAHDLRSPFNTLLGFSTLLDSEVKSGNKENLDNFTREIKISAEKAYYLVDNLLNWAKSQQENFEVKKEQVFLSEIIDEVIDILQTPAEMKNLKINNTIPHDLVLITDSEMIKVIIRNLINNAVKFSYEGGTIEIDCTEKQDRNIISIHDNGIGLSYGDQERLLQENGIFSKSDRTREDGSGLGLLLVKHFLKRLGGELFIQSEPGKGSTFSFAIPK